MVNKSKSSRSPLWQWISVRIITLTIGTAIVVAFCMWLRYAILNVVVMHNMPVKDRIELQQLIKNPAQNIQRFHQMIDHYYGIDYSYPDIGNTDWVVLGIMILCAMPVIAFLGIWMSRPVAIQLSDVVHAAKEVTHGNFSYRVCIVDRAPNEFKELAIDFNAMITKLERYEREIQDSSAILAHELRTPLNAAMGRLQGMIDGIFPSTPEQLQMVLVRLDSLNRLVSDLHFLSLARAGQLQLSKEPFSVSVLIDERLSWVDSQVTMNAIKIHRQIDPHLSVYADRHRLGQVFSILIDNIIRYAADGCYLGISAESNNGLLTMDFSDYGPGIAPHNLERMFDRFWRAENSRALHSGGSGLGLAIASAICSAHGGTIHAFNQEGNGTVMRIALPSHLPL